MEGSSFYEIYYLGLDGVIDWEKTISESITVFEGPKWLNQDLNGDGDSSGTVEVSSRGKDEWSGIHDDQDVILGEDKEGGVYLIDDQTEVRILMNWSGTTNGQRQPQISGCGCKKKMINMKWLSKGQQLDRR